MFTYKLLAGGLTRQTPTSSRFACKYAGLEVFVGLRKLHSNEAIRGISWGQNIFWTQHHLYRIIKIKIKKSVWCFLYIRLIFLFCNTVFTAIVMRENISSFINYSTFWWRTVTPHHLTDLIFSTINTNMVNTFFNIGIILFL